MRVPFQKRVENSERNVVIHNIAGREETISRIKTTDIVFFDDCTYDQYRFICDNISCFSENAIVVGFSTGLYRDDGDIPLTGLTTRQLHDGFHSGNDEFRRGFVTIRELKHLKCIENVYIALHGHSHVFLENENPYERSVIFRKELKKSLFFLEKQQISTNIFVYPYDFSDCLSTSLLKRSGFCHIYPSETHRRIYIEDLTT